MGSPYEIPKKMNGWLFLKKDLALRDGTLIEAGKEYLSCKKSKKTAPYNECNYDNYYAAYEYIVDAVCEGRFPVSENKEENRGQWVVRLVGSDIPYYPISSEVSFRFRKMKVLFIFDASKVLLKYAKIVALKNEKICNFSKNVSEYIENGTSEDIAKKEVRGYPKKMKWEMGDRSSEIGAYGRVSDYVLSKNDSFRAAAISNVFYEVLWSQSKILEPMIMKEAKKRGLL